MVTRNQPEGGTLSTTDPTTICAGDGIGDPIDVTLDGAVGDNMAWIITDAATGNILALPPAPPFDLDGAGPGVCDIYNVSYFGPFSGADVGGNIADLEGCFDLSNPIVVDRQTPEPSVISTMDDVSFLCVADGLDDFIDVEITESGLGEGHQFIITDDLGNILALPPAPPFNFEGTGPGVCMIYCADFFGELGAAVGENVSEISGCHVLSNAISVNRSDATSIGNFVFNDANQNGCQDLGELGIGQVLVQLLAPGPDGVLCTADDMVVATDVTEFNGSYLFSCVAPGDYVVNFSQFPGPFMITEQNACGDDEIDSDVDPATGCSDPFTIIGNGNDLSICLLYTSPSPRDRG